MMISPVSKPTKIIELDGVSAAEWLSRIERRLDVVYLFAGNLWRIEVNGCAVCQTQTSEWTTLVRNDLTTMPCYCCLTHGELQAIPYAVRKVYTITLDGQAREGELRSDDKFLLPTSLKGVERMTFVSKLLDSMQETETASAEPDDF